MISSSLIISSIAVCAHAKSYDEYLQDGIAIMKANNVGASMRGSPLNTKLQQLAGVLAELSAAPGSAEFRMTEDFIKGSIHAPNMYFEQTEHLEMLDYAQQNAQAPNRTAIPTPNEFNWADQGVELGIQNQAQCGACWTFSSSAAISLAYGIYTQSKSQSDIIQVSQCAYLNFENQNQGCDVQYPYYPASWQGCQGGTPAWVFLGVGIDIYFPGTEQAHETGLRENPFPVLDMQEWQYLPENELSNMFAPATDVCLHSLENGNQCREQKPDSRISPSILNSWRVEMVTKGTQRQAMQDLYRYGMLTITVDGASAGFQTYSGGVLTSDTWECTKKDHAVALTGFSNGANPYFVLRNSWTTNWGLNGYAHIEMKPDQEIGAPNVGCVLEQGYWVIDTGVKHNYSS